jgi:hypothetical protein
MNRRLSINHLVEGPSKLERALDILVISSMFLLAYSLLFL